MPIDLYSFTRLSAMQAPPRTILVTHSMGEERRKQLRNTEIDRVVLILIDL